MANPGILHLLLPGQGGEPRIIKGLSIYYCPVKVANPGILHLLLPGQGGEPRIIKGLSIYFKPGFGG